MTLMQVPVIDIAPYRTGDYWWITARTLSSIAMRAPVKTVALPRAALLRRAAMPRKSPSETTACPPTACLSAWRW